MKKIIKFKAAASFVLPMALMVTLEGCGLIQDRSGEYATADPGQRLTVPVELSDLKIGSRYPIPEVTSQTKVSVEGYELPRPPSTTTALSVEPYLVETVGDQTWLSLYSSPGKIWPLLDFYWQENGVTVAKQFIQQGYVSTDMITASSPIFELIQNDVPTALGSYAIQAKLTQGVKRNSTEIQVRLVASNSDKTLSDASWLELESQAKVEAALLESIGRFISSDELRNRQSLLANDISGEPKVFLRDEVEGGKYLHLKLSYLRALNEIGKALEASDVLLSDTDQTEGKYFVSYLSEDELDSWLSTEANRAEKRLERNLEVSVKEVEYESEKIIEVRVKSLNDEFDTETEDDLLTIIYEHIS